jgi:hypothetical protein
VGAVKRHAAIVQVVLAVLGDEKAPLFERKSGVEGVIFASVPDELASAFDVDVQPSKRVNDLVLDVLIRVEPRLLHPSPAGKVVRKRDDRLPRHPRIERTSPIGCERPCLGGNAAADASAAGRSRRLIKDIAFAGSETGA